MVAKFQQILVIALALLQLPAPLVHAHSDAHGAATGIHLHELEIYGYAHHAPEFSTVHGAVGAESAIVEVGPLLKRQTTPDQPLWFCLLPEPLPCAANDCNTLIGFSPHAAVFVASPHFSQLSPRAPPV